MTQNQNGDQEPSQMTRASLRSLGKYASMRMIVRHPQTNELVTFYAKGAKALFDLIFHRVHGCSTRFIAHEYVQSIVEKLGPCVETKAHPKSGKPRYFLDASFKVKIVDYDDNPLPENP